MDFVGSTDPMAYRRDRRKDQLLQENGYLVLRFLDRRTKWNLASSWLLNTNLLIRVTDAGLRARVTPAISLDYAFER
jgi:hypothetical protein